MSSNSPTTGSLQDVAQAGSTEQQFISDYYAQLSDEDTAEYDAAILNARALTHRALALTGPPAASRWRSWMRPSQRGVHRHG